MSDSQAKEAESTPKSGVRRALRWGAILIAATAILHLAVWLIERSLQSPAKKRAMQSWLDENLNADVSLLGDMAIRLNLLHRSRLYFNNTEIEHPNPIGFAGKFARIGRMGARIPPWAVLRLYPGALEMNFHDAHLGFEQNEFGEWSHDGLMSPLAVGNAPFPFMIPRISDWQAAWRDGSLSVKRRNYELKMQMDCRFLGNAGDKFLRFHADAIPFTFGKADAPSPVPGVAGPVNLRLQLGAERGDMPDPVAGHCSANVKDMPVSFLPFVAGGIPLEDVPGIFRGLIRYDECPDAAGALFLEGELADVPLSIFGLPRNAPLRATWPVLPGKDGLRAQIRMGPSGFGGFEINVDMDAGGLPRLLSMRGDFAELDVIPSLFTRYSRWPDWLSRTFPGIEWRASKWRGFGWSGDNLQLSLSRVTSGLTLKGEAEMMGGKTRLAMTPDQREAPITVAAERLDAGQFAARIMNMLPEPFRASLDGSHVNLSWRGLPGADGQLEEWGLGMVWVKPTVDLRASGSWWRGMMEIPQAIARALPEWGGGSAGGLSALSVTGIVPLDQVSVVVEKEATGELIIEYRAFGNHYGQVTGLIERRRDGLIEGEYLLAGSSRLLEEVAAANPSLSLSLNLLANETPGLRVAFTAVPGEKPSFTYPFLDDAKRIAVELREREASTP